MIRVAESVSKHTCRTASSIAFQWRSARTRGALLLAMVCMVDGCAFGSASYVQPAPVQDIDIERVVDAPRDQVWDHSIPELAKHFFVINNIDKSSGLINLSFSGNPEQYIDCGRIHSEVLAPSEDETYDFPAARESQAYELVSDGVVRHVNRTMSLDGRVNIILQEIDGGTTRVRVNTRYVVTRNLSQHLAGEYPSISTDTIQFNSNGSSWFPAGPDGVATICHANGSIEKAILELVH